MKEDRDLEAIEAVLQGDKNAFRQLVERYQPAVSALGRRMLPPPREELSDYVQEVFLKAFANLRQFSGTGRFYSWLMRIAYTTGLNRVQRAAPEDPEDPQLLSRRWAAPRETNPERLALRAAVLEAVVEAIRGLPKQSALPVELFFVMKMRYKEIEAVTGVPVNTLKSQVRRARELLREKLGAQLLEEGDDL
jgi:RNA polymerase sigma-70 factor (ECF subfamily)